MKGRVVEAQILVLVTLALVAFGLVMVYSATSAAAALGNADPSYFLKRQGIYARARASRSCSSPRGSSSACSAGSRPFFLIGSFALCTLVSARAAGERRAAVARDRPAHLPALGAGQAVARDLGRRATSPGASRRRR